ncbi:MAG TPA: pantetheine-phosphate adenylyltransferase [Clostridiales bacterium]|jgi:pantetheine-phosphate adenylyltransferase|nr:pantetheine-phosphate adenylyltransferase [Clostridiales bacterium]
MRIAVVPGSFDPITIAHCDIIARAAKLFDLVYVCVLANINKRSMFTSEQRVGMMQKVLKDMKLDNCKATSYEGLLIDFAKEASAVATVRGVRSISDYEAELAMADINNKLNNALETVILLSRPEHRAVSSSVVREILAFGGDISELVPMIIVDDIKAYYNRKDA